MKKLDLLVISFVFLLFFTNIPNSHSESMNLPKDYNQTLDLEQTLIYRFEKVNETSNYVEFGWGGPHCALEEGGSLELIFNGVYNESTWWGGVVTEPFFNITFKHADGSVNRTLTNKSNNAIADALILSISPWYPGILTTINWTYHDETAESLASSGWMEGTLNISSDNGFRTYNYTQKGGAQKTILVYNETSGLLDNWNTSFGNYYLEARFPSEDIPSYPIVVIFGVSTLTVIFVLKEIIGLRKNKNSISKF
ncbi:MAG: hypothetical protein ACTSRX_06790 [Promethearchaeota archaeon]